MRPSRETSRADYERWQRLRRRVARLQAAFDRRECIDAALANDRYLSLCATIAHASNQAEAARVALGTGSAPPT